MPNFSRRTFLAGAASLALASRRSFAARSDLEPIYAEIKKRHQEAIERIQRWIHQPTIAAENVGGEEGVKLAMDLFGEAGFTNVTRIPTDGKPGIFAVYDAGAPRTVGLYFMYDVKQADASEWKLGDPWKASIVQKPGMGKCIIGRGAVNQKGPEAAFLAALHAIRGAGKKPPVNFVLVAEGEEEIGSPHFPQVVRAPQVMQALGKCMGIFMPSAGQAIDGTTDVTLGAKGVIEAQIISSGEKWGRGPSKDVHSSLRAMLDSPAFHLVQALGTLVTPDGVDPAIDGWFERVKPLSAAEKKMVADVVAHGNEQQMKDQFGVKHWERDVPFEQAMERLCGWPTVNIEGLVGGYTGQGGKTVLPHQAVAKMDFRLVPDMTVDDCLHKLRAHLDKRGFNDVEVVMTGGYDPNTTAPDAALIRAQEQTYRRAGQNPLLWPRGGGSWPGYVFTDAPLKLAAGHFGLGHGSGAHAPDEYFLVESENPKLFGLDDMVKSFVDYLHDLAAIRS
ncbi:MAG TPA: M20/M25/M40 family metallo-hydrolase [Myxococcales bacterium]|nr:M20/M25/M40 family metallo-hydrolase [Myxococcales bacterium]